MVSYTLLSPATVDAVMDHWLLTLIEHTPEIPHPMIISVCKIIKLQQGTQNYFQRQLENNNKLCDEQ